MKRSWSLTSKTALLVMLPIVLQVAMLFLVVGLHQQAESQLATIAQSQRLISLLNDTNNDVYQLMYFMVIQKLQFTDISQLTKLRELATRIDTHLAQLSQCAPDDNEIQQDIEQARKLKRGASELLFTMAGSYSDPNGSEQARERLREKVRAIFFEATLDLLPRISKKQASLVDMVPAACTQLRSEQERIILVLAVLELFLSIGIAYVFTRSIVARISGLNDTTNQLAANVPLNPPDTGADEIANLDQTIRKLAQELKAASGRASLLVENASDAIITLDRSGKINSVNQASAVKLGYDASDLIGTRFAQYAHPSSRSTLMERLGALKETGEGEFLECQLLKKDDTVLDVSVSTTWFAPENCFFCIVHDVTSQKKAQQLKNEIVTMVSHDLKTPLSTVDYLLGAFEQNETVRTAVGEDLGMARRNIERVIQLVIDFLDTEKIESNMYPLSIQSVKLSDIFRTSREACIGLADQKGVDLSFSVSDQSLKGDFDALSRVLTNLVTNAVNHSPSGSSVRVKALASRDQVKISVSDEGSGLAPEVSEKIFERFYQAPGKRTVGSSGLGLTICKLLVELGHGTIGVDSTPGSGSTFYFTVPIDASAHS